MNQLPAIVAGIISALVGGLGTIDLSDDDQVKEGTYERPPGTFTFAGITPPKLLSSEPQARNTWYLETYQTEIRLWVPVVNVTTDDRAEWSRLAVQEMAIALDVEHDTVGTALWRTVFWRVASTAPDPAAANALPGWARAAMTVEFTFRRKSGA